MRFTAKQIEELTFGAVRTEEKGGYLHFYRMTPEQAALYPIPKDGNLRTMATASVKLDFTTDADAISFSYQLVRTSGRSFCGFDLLMNGYLIDSMIVKECPLTLEGHYRFDLPWGSKRITLYLPYSYSMAMKDLELKQATYAKRAIHSRKLLAFGDSITQGFDTYHPSLSYINRLGTLLDAEVINKGIGGDRFRPAILEHNDGYQPDIVTVAYGTNDWSRSSRETLLQDSSIFFEKATARYPAAKRYAITPIWRKQWKKIMPSGSFDESSDIIAKAAQENGFTVFDGRSMAPHTEEFFTDGTHPIDLGHFWYGSRLAEAVQGKISLDF